MKSVVENTKKGFQYGWSFCGIFFSILNLSTKTHSEYSKRMKSCHRCCKQYIKSVYLWSADFV